MHESEPSGPATEAWLSLSDDLLWGFNHALSNRLAAISSIVRILEYSETGLDPLLSTLADEVTTLERTLGLLRLLPRNSEGIAEPIRLDDLIPEVLELHRVRGELRDLAYTLEIQPDTLPTCLEPARLTHAVLIALDGVSRTTLERGGEAVSADVSGDEKTLTLTFRGSSAFRDQEAVREYPEEGPAVEPSTAAGAASIDLAPIISLTVADPDAEVVDARHTPDATLILRIPTLLHVRQRPP